VLTHAGYNDRMRRDEETGRWRLTARGPNCATAASGLLVLSVPGYITTAK